MNGLENKVAIVTGGATLIGAAVVKAFLAAGARVVIADIDTAGGSALAGELGTGVRFVRTDLASDVDITACVEAAVADYARIDFLVNVAAAYVDSGMASSRADWHQAFDVNVFGGVMLLKAVYPYLLKSGGGAVVNFGSTSATSAQAGRWLYPASKAALLQLTRSQALDLAKDRIRVNAVSPGWTWSGIMNTLSGGDKDKTNRVAGKYHMLGRIGEPEEVAAAVLFLCSSHASFITGVNLPVDGGYSALGPEQCLSPINDLLN